MKTNLRLRLSLGTAGALVVLTVSTPCNAIPSWWISGGVLNPSAATNDYAPVTQGAVKNMAVQALAEMTTNLHAGGAGSAVSNLVNSFSTTNNYLLANIGQLKYVAQPFYDRLIAVGCTNAYPWATGSSTNDYAAANVGQLKNLFSWDLTYSTVGDGIPDWWRQYYFNDGTTTNSQSCASCDPESDGQSNLSKYLAGSAPLDYPLSLLNETLPLPSCFTNVFISGSPVISIQPTTNMNLFYYGESVTITSVAPIEVYQLTYGGGTTQVTSHSSPVTLSSLGPGQYFVQSGSDRAEFAVFPADYSKLQNIGHNSDYLQPAYIGYADRAKLGWVRATLEWGDIQTNEGIGFNWNGWVPVCCPADLDVARITNWFSRANIILYTGTANYTNTSIGFGTNWAYYYDAQRYCNDLSNFLVAAHAEYGTNVIVQLDPLSEAADGAVNTNFNVSNYSGMASQVYAAVAAAWPGTPEIGPSESSISSPYPANFKAAGVDKLLDAVDYHDYEDGHGDITGDPDYWQWGVIARVASNETAMAKTNVFVTELGLLGASALGNTNDPSYIYYGNCDGFCSGIDSLPPISWYRGMTRAMRTAVLYAQYRAVLILTGFGTGGALEQVGVDTDGSIKPNTIGFLMANYWLNGSTPVTNWVSGVSSNLHFAESVWANGTTNAFVWAPEGTTTTTNLGVTVTDIWSNQWTGPIGEEPVIAWGWAGH